MQNKPNGLKLLTEKRKSGWLKLLAAVFVCILPVIILWGIFKVNNNKLADFHLINSDEFDYYAETVSIARNGLINHASGYFGYSLDKHAKVLNYGAHAPFNLLPLALAAKLTGSSQATVLLANLVSLCVSLLIFYVLRRSLRDLALIFLLLFSFSSE